MAGMTKFGFKIKTRGGMIVENLMVQAPARPEAETRIRQIYQHCEILECSELSQETRDDGVDLEDVISLITKQGNLR